MRKATGLMMAGAALALALAGAARSASVPELGGGVWYPIEPPQTLRTVDGKVPPLRPAAKALYLQHVTARRAGDLSFDRTEQCMSPGVPRLLTLPSPFEFIQRPEKVAILYEWNRLARFVDMGVPQPEVLGPAGQGQSVGKWLDHTLVVDSIGFTDNTTLDASGLPHSDALHVIERYTPSADGQTMTARITIDDPKFYSSRWDTQLRFRHDARGEIHEDVCVLRKAVKWTWKKDRQ
jgi:hypothetical protein